MIRAGKMWIPDEDAYFARVFSETGDRFDFDVLKAAVHATQGRQMAIDVGAHVGSWTKHLAGLFGSVWAFEPQPENYACLTRNVGLLESVRPLPFALGEKAGVVSLAKGNTNSGCWYVSPGREANMLTLDELTPAHCDLLKLDVEGYEGQVIQGALETIKRCRPTIVLEQNGVGLKYFADGYVDPVPLLTSLGYTRQLRIRKDEIWMPSP